MKRIYWIGLITAITMLFSGKASQAQVSGLLEGGMMQFTRTCRGLFAVFIATTLVLSGCGESGTEPEVTDLPEVNDYLHSLPDWSAFADVQPDEDAPAGDERGRLDDLLETLRAAAPNTGRVLLDGRPSAHERWDLSVLAPLFRRWT